MSSSATTSGQLFHNVAKAEEPVEALAVRHSGSQVAAAKDLGDEQLMARVQAGSSDAFTSLFDRYSRLVYGVGLRILREPAEADELVQDVFIYVHRHSRVFDACKGTFRSWLVQASYSRAFNRREQLLSKGFYDRTEIEDIEHLADSASSDGLLNVLYARKVIGQALEELSESQRRTLLLFFFDGYSLREISSLLDESFVNVRHYYYRGLEKLRDRLKTQSCRRKME